MEPDFHEEGVEQNTNSSIRNPLIRCEERADAGTRPAIGGRTKTSGVIQLEHYAVTGLLLSAPKHTLGRLINKCANRFMLARIFTGCLLCVLLRLDQWSNVFPNTVVCLRGHCTVQEPSPTPCASVQTAPVIESRLLAVPVWRL